IDTALKYPAARYGARRTVSVEDHPDIGISELHLGDMDRVSPDDYRLASGSHDVAGVPGSMARRGNCSDPRQDVAFAVEGLDRPRQVRSELNSASIEIDPRLTLRSLGLLIVVEPVGDLSLMYVNRGGRE